MTASRPSPTVAASAATIYVVGHRRDYLPVIEEARVGLFGAHKPAETLLGVETLAVPGYLIEVDAIAVTD
jgi:enamine deaminase RidA (YjgF/YER057c/UK114 family)